VTGKIDGLKASREKVKYLFCFFFIYTTEIAQGSAFLILAQFNRL